MADHILSAKVQVTAPGVQQTFDGISNAAGRTETSLKKLPNAATGAANALTRTSTAAQRTRIQTQDLGRVIQDLPFGFVGIQNNLTQLIPAVGGLGLAFSGLIALITFSQTGLSNWTRGMGGASEAAKEHKKEVDEVAKKQDELNKIFAESAAQVINQAEKFADLKRSLIDTSNSYNDLTASVIKQGIAQALFSQKEGVFQSQLNRRIADQLQNLGKLREATFEEFKPIKPFQFEKVPDNILGTLADDKITKAFKDRVSVEKEEEHQLEAINDIANLLGITFDQFIKKTKGPKAVKFEYDALKAIFIDLIALQKTFGAQLEAQAKVRFKMNLDFAEGAGSAFDNFTKEVPKVSNELQKTLDRLTANNPILLRRKVNAKFELGNEKALENFANTISRQLGSALENSLEGVGENLGEALVTGDLSKGIKGFLTTIAQGIQEVGKSMIRAAITIKIAKDALLKAFQNPALLLAAGIALVAVGAAMKKSFDGARALGGPVRAGGSYLVGENGPELFVPDTGGKIVSNSNISGGASISGGMAVQVMGQLIVRGNDLIAALSNANRSQGRLA